MKKLLFIGCVAFFACNNSTTNTPTSGDSTSKTATTPMPKEGWTKEDEMEMIDECMAGAQAKYDKEKAYKYCSCLVTQIKANYNAADTTIAEKLKDTTELARLGQNCD